MCKGLSTRDLHMGDDDSGPEDAEEQADAARQVSHEEGEEARKKRQAARRGLWESKVCSG